MDCSLPGSSCPWNSPGKNTEVGGHPLLQGIFLTLGSNSGLLHCRPILNVLSKELREQSEEVPSGQTKYNLNIFMDNYYNVL